MKGYVKGVDAIVLASVRIAKNAQHAVKIKLLNFRIQNIPILITKWLFRISE